jgi:hypothetical protein
MFQQKTPLFLLLILLSFNAFAQKKYLIGRVIDGKTNKGVDNVAIKNQHTKEVGRTNSKGVFLIWATAGDSIIATSRTHGRAAIAWDGVTKDPIIWVNPHPAEKLMELDEVQIVGKKEEDLKREIKEFLAEPEAKKGLTGEQTLDYLASGSAISLLYDAFSQRAKSDRRVAMYKQQDRKTFYADLRFNMLATRATNLRGEDLDRFRKYCNILEDFLLQGSDYDVTFEIVKCWRRYQ